MTVHKVVTENTGFTNITTQVEAEIQKSGRTEGCFLVCSLDSMAGIIVTSEAEEAVREDILCDVKHMIPPRLDYPSTDCPDGAAAKSRTAVVGETLNLIMHDGKLLLDRGQAVYLVDFMGKRELAYAITVC